MYKIVGGDNKEYGPVTTEQVREWIVQNRANANTIVSFEGGPWKPLSSFPEFSDLLKGGAVPVTPLVTHNAPNMFDEKRSNWLGIAGLVVGIVAMVPCCCMCPLLSVIAIVLGVIGLVQIQNNPDRYVTSRNIPIAAIILGVLSIILFFAITTNPAFKEQRQRFIEEYERRL